MASIAKLGVCWFQPEQWTQAKELFTDSDSFGESYEEWRKTANEALSALVAGGHTPVKVKINLDEIAEWCKEKGVPADSKARSEFIAATLRRKKQ